MWRPIWKRKKQRRPSKLESEVKYWLTRTAHLRHSDPFNKRDAGRLRRLARKFKHDMRGDDCYV